MRHRGGGAAFGHCGDEVDITLPGGTLRIQWDGTGEVMMEGPATEVFTGEWAI